MSKLAHARWLLSNNIDKIIWTEQIYKKTGEGKARKAPPEKPAIASMKAYRASCGLRLHKSPIAINVVSSITMKLVSVDENGFKYALPINSTAHNSPAIPIRMCNTSSSSKADKGLFKIVIEFPLTVGIR